MRPKRRTAPPGTKPAAGWAQELVEAAGATHCILWSSAKAGPGRSGRLIISGSGISGGVMSCNSVDDSGDEIGEMSGRSPTDSVIAVPMTGETPGLTPDG